jgi:hypothetical protein
MMRERVREHRILILSDGSGRRSIVVHYSFESTFESILYLLEIVSREILENLLLRS